MNLQADAVSQPVAEVLGVAGVRDDLPRRRVDVLERHPGCEEVPARPLGGRDEFIDVELPLSGRRQHECAGHVGVVAAHQGAEVDLHEVPGGQHRIGRPMVRDRRIRSGRHDGLEGHAVGTVIEHQRLEFAAHLFLCPARLQPTALDQILQRRVGGFTGQSQQRDLAGVLDFAQGLHGPGGPHQTGLLAGRLGERRVSVDGHDVTLEAQPGHTVGGRARDEVRSAGPLDDDLGVGGLLCRLRAVPPVGGQHRCRVFRPNQQRRVRSGETGQITDVDQVRYQHRVQVGGDQALAQPVPAL